MPWYYFEIRGGNGGQSKEHVYRWFDSESDAAGVEQEIVDDSTARWWSRVDRVITTKLDVLPEDVRLEKLRYYEHTIRVAQKMIHILQGTDKS